MIQSNQEKSIYLLPDIFLSVRGSVFSELSSSSHPARPSREHAEDGQQSGQPAVPDPNDHPRPRERHQTVAPGQEPRPLRPEGRGQRKQDGV